MDDRERTILLTDLHRGAMSRNRDFLGFQHPERRRVWSAYRKIRSLLQELQLPGARGAVHRSSGDGSLAVAVQRSCLRYRRVVVMTRWEAAFFLQQVAGLGAKLDAPLQNASAVGPAER